MTGTRRLTVGLLVFGLLATLGGWATYSAFSSATTNTGNTFAIGTVAVSDNDTGSAMYSVTNQKPGDTVTSCLKVTYTGSLDADMALFASAVGPVGNYVNLTVTPGTGNVTFPGCTGFTPDGAAIYNGTLKNFADTHASFSTGLVDNPGSATGWVPNDSVVYQFALTLQDNNLANGGATALSTGAHSFTWEARNK